MNTRLHEKIIAALILAVCVFSIGVGTGKALDHGDPVKTCVADTVEQLPALLAAGYGDTDEGVTAYVDSCQDLSPTQQEQAKDQLVAAFTSFGIYSLTSE